MNDLFIQPIQMTKTAYKHVSDNPVEWTGNVMENFYNQFPYFANSKVTVAFTQKDEQKGYAIGTITIQEGPGISVPIIIKDKELYPFDVAIMGGNTIPLTETTLQLFAQSPGAFLRTVKPDAGDITTALFNQSHSQVITPTYITENYKQASAISYDDLVAAEQMLKKAGRPYLAKDVEDLAVKMYKEAEESKLEKREEKEHKDLDHDNEKGESEAHKEKVLGKKKIFDKKAAVLGASHLAYTRHGGPLEGIDAVPKEPETAAYYGSIKHQFQTKINPNEHTKPLSSAHTPALDAMGKRADFAKSETERIPGPGPQTSIAEEVAKAEARSPLWQLLRPNEHNLETVNEGERQSPKVEADAGDGKNRSVLDKISHTITQQMKDSFVNQIQKNASLVEGFKRNGTAGIILKIATLSPGKADYKERLHHEIDRDLQYIYKEGSHEWKAVFGSSKVDDPVTLTINDNAAQQLDHIKTSAKMPEMEKVANYEARGIVKCAGQDVIVLTNNDYAYVPTGVTMVSSIVSQFDAVEPVITKTATFVHPSSSFPMFEVTRIYNDHGKERIETFDGLQKTAYVKMKGIETPTTEGGITYVPEDAAFIKLGKQVEIPVSVFTKLGANKITKVDDNYYDLSGPIFNEYLKKTAHVSDLHKTSWTLLQLGAAREEVEKLASMKSGEVLHVASDLFIPASFEKVAEAWGEQHAALAARIDSIAKDLIKEASLLTDAPTVDAVLALNFVNKNNIREFADTLPLLNEVSKQLADMLLKTRLGVQLIDEGVLRRTMLGVIDVIEALSGVSNLAGNKV